MESTGKLLPKLIGTAADGSKNMAEVIGGLRGNSEQRLLNSDCDGGLLSADNSGDGEWLQRLQRLFTKGDDGCSSGSHGNELRRGERRRKRDVENENGGTCVHSGSLKKRYILANDEWKEDILPEILDGHNVADFLDGVNRAMLPSRLQEKKTEEGSLVCLAEGEKKYPTKQSLSEFM